MIESPRNSTPDKKILRRNAVILGGVGVLFLAFTAKDTPAFISQFANFPEHLQLLKSGEFVFETLFGLGGLNYARRARKRLRTMQ